VRVGYSKSKSTFFLQKESSKENGIFAQSAKIAILSASLSL
jgi:hypothetical protein